MAWLGLAPHLKMQIKFVFERQPGISNFHPIIASVLFAVGGWLTDCRQSGSHYISQIRITPKITLKKLIFSEGKKTKPQKSRYQSINILILVYISYIFSSVSLVMADMPRKSDQHNTTGRGRVGGENVPTFVRCRHRFPILYKPGPPQILQY